MTRGDRHAALGSSELGFGQMDVMTSSYSLKALAKLLMDVSRSAPQSAAKQELIAQGIDGLDGVGFGGERTLKPNNLKQFLNRLLGCTCAVQRSLFDALAFRIKELEDADRKDGTFDQGVVSLNRGGRWGRLRSIDEVDARPLADGAGGLTLRRLRLDRGLPFEAAAALLRGAAPDALQLQGF
ncbi:unnamed protein product, partial [Prorocentrum cordatum]